MKILNSQGLTEICMVNQASDNYYPTSANEPIVHSLIKKSFAFVPTVGMRHAPEIILIELFREVFPNNFCEAIGEKSLDPNDLNEDGSYYYTMYERAVLCALRGRRRKTESAKAKPFYAPAYASLIRNSWLRKRSDRVVNKLLLSGAIAQHLWHKGGTEEKKIEQSNFVDLVIKALIGQNSYHGDDPRGKDILSIAAAISEPIFESKQAKHNLLEKTQSNSVFRIDEDPLSYHIFKDFSALCTLEKDLPRMQWIQVLMTFLRFALPMWLLAQMRITIFLHEWLVNAIDNKRILNLQDIKSTICKRNLELLHPTLTPTREIFEHTERYIRHRIELNLLLYNLQYYTKEQFGDRYLVLDGSGSQVLTIEQLLILARDSSKKIKKSSRYKKVTEGDRIQNFLIREAEQFQAWRDPRNKGQGKNIDEFFRVLYRDNLGDEAGGFLLISEGRGRTRGFRVFPGQLLLKTFTFLANHEKQTRSGVKGGGKLVLEDVENHFKQYGIDFSYAADARPMLMKELQAMGLLTGSPDAGSSVAVSCPY